MKRPDKTGVLRIMGVVIFICPKKHYASISSYTKKQSPDRQTDMKGSGKRSEKHKQLQLC